MTLSDARSYFRQALILGLPVTLFLGIVLSIAPQTIQGIQGHLGGSSEALQTAGESGQAGFARILTRAYAFFLYLYLLVIFIFDYLKTPHVHDGKGPVLGSFLTLAIFYSVYFFNTVSGQQLAGAQLFEQSVIGLACLTMSLVVWELYTMRSGFRRSWDSIISDVPKSTKTLMECASDYESRHWAEYIWWVRIDGSLFVLLCLAFLLRSVLFGILSETQVLILIPVIGGIVGIVNSYRYRCIAEML